MKNFDRKTGGMVLAGLGTAAMVLLVFFNNADTVKVLAMVTMITALTAMALRFGAFRQRMNPILLTLTLITAVGGLSTAYAISGKFALQGFLYLMTALCGAILLTLLPQRTGAVILAATAAFMSLVSIDHLSTRLLSGPVLTFFSRFTTVFDGVSGVEEQVRLTSVFGMPNVFAGCTGLGVLLSLGLAMSAKGKGERRLELCLLYVNALGFLLSFSMGATASIAVGFLVYLLLERRENRSSLFVLMGLTLVTVVLGLIPVSVTVLDGWQGIQPIPLLCVFAGAALLCAADHYLREKLTGMTGKITLFGGILGVSVVIFAVAACLLTGGAKLSQGESLRRAVYPAGGTYTLTAVSSGDLSVTVESQNRQEAMMHTATVLYSGDLDGAAFAVPEDSLVVYLNFHARSQGSLDRVTLESAAGSLDVPLAYILLPDFIANRLQGFFANQNAIQRQVFFSDGLKLFAQSPLLGHGIGAFESATFRVQSFYYETKYVHNHYIQTLLETGVIGLALFVGLLAVSAAAILRNRKRKDRHPFLPALGALVVYMGIHAAVEVVFSVGFYLPLAFGVFALLGGCCRPVPKKCGTVSVGMVGVLLLTFTVLLGCNLRAARIGHNAKTMEDFQQAQQLDPFEWTDYALSYVANAPAQGSEQILRQAEDYVTRLDKQQSNNIHYHLARYCFRTGQMERGMEMALKQAQATVSSSQWWDTLFLLLYEYDDGSAAFRAGVRNLVDLMTRWNGENMGRIVLNEAVQSYVDHVLTR